MAGEQAGDVNPTGAFERIVFLLYGHPRRTATLAPEERLRLATLGGARAYMVIVVLMTVVFTPITALMALDVFAYNAPPRVGLIGLTLYLLWRSYRPDYRADGAWFSAASLYALSAMVLFEVWVSGVPDHPFLYTPTFFLLGMALFLPARGMTFAVIASGIVVGPTVIIAVGVLPANEMTLTVYLMFGVAISASGWFACRQRREHILQQYVMEEAVREHAQELAEALQALHRAQEQMVTADRMAVMGQITVGLSRELLDPLGQLIEAFEAIQVDEGATPSMISAAMTGAQSARKAWNYLADAQEQAKVVTDKEAKQFDVYRWVRGAQEMMNLRAETVGLQIELFGMGGILIEADPGAFAQVLRTLLSVALDRCEAAGTTKQPIEARVEVSEEGVLVRIVDHGPEVSAVAAKTAFQPLAEERVSQRGTGLELSICRDLVVGSLGGNLTLEHTAGGGATFVIAVPPVTAPLPTTGSHTKK